MNDKFKSDIGEQIKKVATLVTSFGAHKPQYFKSIEYDYEMSKQEIIDTLHLFKKAKMFYFKFIQMESVDDDYDFGSAKRMHDYYTGGFELFFNAETTEVLSLEKKLIYPTGSKVLNGMTHEEVANKLNKLINQRDVYNKSKKGQKHREFVKQTLKDLIDSPKKRNDFLKKYAKHLKLPITPEDATRTIGELKINLITGDFTYHNKLGNFNPKNQEHKMIHTLIHSPENHSSYGELLKVISPGTNPENKTSRDILYTIIKKINKELGISQKSSLIQNVKNFGYRIRS